MKNLALLLIFAGIITACSPGSLTDSYDYSIESTIYSDSKKTNFAELVFILTPKFAETLPTDKKFIVTDKICNIKININGVLWGIYNSEILDTINLSNTVYSEFKVSDDKTSYLIIAKLTPQEPKNLTAGEFANYLNAYNTLSPGSYVCEISELNLVKENNDTLKIRPRIFQYVNILADTYSAYLGEFEIIIK